MDGLIGIINGMIVNGKLNAGMIVNGKLNAEPGGSPMDLSVTFASKNLIDVRNVERKISLGSWS
jgi:hypothetical protein